MDLPIVCTLNEADLQKRRQAIMNVFRNMQVGVSELPDGYAYSFSATSEALQTHRRDCGYGAPVLPISHL